MYVSSMRARPWIRGGGGGGGGLNRLHCQRAPSRPSFARRFSQDQAQNHQWGHVSWSDAPVRILRPAAWSVAAITTIFFTCAAYDVHQDVRQCATPDGTWRLGFDELQVVRAARRLRDRREPRAFAQQQQPPPDLSSPRAAWDGLGGPDRVLACAAATSAAVQALSSLLPSPAPVHRRLAHYPVDWHFRGHQLLTSAFVHDGPVHLLVNFFVMYQFAPSLARTPEFRGSGAHTCAFYLSAAVASALGGHASCRFPPNRMHRFSAGMGFSGVVSAVFAAWCLEHPDARVGIVLLPFDFTATSMLQASAVFETAGLLGLFQLLRIPINVSFATHLSGLAFGAAYVTYSKRERLWNGFRRAAFRTLRAAGVV